MSELQEAEVAKLHGHIEKDVNNLIEKYMKVMSWEVPENDEGAAREMILKEIRSALEKL